jgi:multiple sugar transport system permease protein
MTTATAAASTPTERVARNKKKLRPSRVFLHLFLIAFAALWLLPVLWAVFTSFRSYGDTAIHGYVSWPHALSLVNYRTAWTNAALPHFFFNSMIVAVPAIVLILLLASSVAFVVSRFSYWFNVPLLIFFMSANLLPQQVILTPLYNMYLRMPLPNWLSDSGLFYDSYVGIILINVAFQTGFCTFVLANYMKTIPSTLNEAARVDGAGVFRQFFGIILPLCKPAIAALAVLEFTFIYNDFLWPIVLMKSGNKQPITAALNSLQGIYFSNNNLIAAASLMVAIPTLIVFAALQRQFISGLTLGANKG